MRFFTQIFVTEYKKRNLTTKFLVPAAFDYVGEDVSCFEQNAGTRIAKGIVAIFSHTEDNRRRGSFFTSHAGLYHAKIGFNCKRALLVL